MSHPWGSCTTWHNLLWEAVLAGSVARWTWSCGFDAANPVSEDQPLMRRAYGLRECLTCALSPFVCLFVSFFFMRLSSELAAFKRLLGKHLLLLIIVKCREKAWMWSNHVLFWARVLAWGPGVRRCWSLRSLSTASFMCVCVCTFTVALSSPLRSLGLKSWMELWGCSRGSKPHCPHHMWLWSTADVASSQRHVLNVETTHAPESQSRFHTACLMTVSSCTDLDLGSSN